MQEKTAIREVFVRRVVSDFLIASAPYSKFDFFYFIHF